MLPKHDPWPPPRVVTQPFSWPLPPLPGRPTPLDVLVPGETISTEHGPFYLRRTHLPLDTTYGPCRLGDFLALRAGSAAALARSPGWAPSPWSAPCSWTPRPPAWPGAPAPTPS